jgi:23S rRNA pseudouridine2605 synthase
MREGKKRQIREVGKTIGLPVVKIIRERIGTLQLGNLKPREWRYLTAEEVAVLKGQTMPKGQPGKARPLRVKAGPRPKKSGESSRPRRTTERGKRR